MLTVALFGLLLPMTAQGTTVRGFTTRAMTLEAAAVFRGRVVSKTGIWSDDKSKIYTESVIAVGEVLAGKVDKKQVTVRQLGGTVGEVRMHVEGIAPLTVGEEVVLFARTDGARWYLVGMAQGKFAVTRDKAGAEIVTREVAGLKRVQVGKRVGVSQRSPRWDQPPQTYAAFAAQIRAWAKERAK